MKMMFGSVARRRARDLERVQQRLREDDWPGYLVAARVMGARYPEDPAFLTELAFALFGAGDLGESGDVADKLVRLPSASLDQRMRVVPSLRASGRLDQVEEVLDQVDGLVDVDRALRDHALFQRGLLAAARGDDAGAERCLRAAVERDPGPFVGSLMQFLVERDRVDEARDLLPIATEAVTPETLREVFALLNGVE
jgi:tetratricopeptide (TPR) repeat protein